MTTATNRSSSGIPTFSIKIEGSEISNEINVLSILVDKEVNTIARAKIILLDGNAITGEFEASSSSSSSSSFVPGNRITIEAGYDSKSDIIFKGIICEQTIRINSHIGSALEVICYDESIKTTVCRQSKTFINKKDSDIMSAILENSGISKAISSTDPVLPQVVQYDSTDWDFVLSRAAANGLIVKTINGKVFIEKPDANTNPVLSLTFGDNLMEFNANLNAINQLKKVTTSAWDYANQEVISQEKVNSYLGAGNLSSSKLSNVIGLDSFSIQTPTSIKDEELVNCSDALLVKSNYSKIQGLVTHSGTSKVEVGNYITLEGVGNRFNGDHFVSKVVHDISEGNWTTACSIGLSEAWIAKQEEAKPALISGMVSRANGLFTGTVKQIHQDPENQYRVLVDVPIFDDSGTGIWARHSSFYASSNAGAFFMPEIDDEVIVGFLNEDPRFPIILGSLYSNSKLKPFEGLVPNKWNTTKAIVSKSGIEIIFDDENQIFTIVTPNKNSIVFNDEEKQITIQDENSNHIIMSQDGIVLKSENNISIESDKNVSIKGAGGISLESNADITCEGSNIQHKANVEFSAEGSASASIKASGTLTLQGAVVQIN